MFLKAKNCIKSNKDNVVSGKEMSQFLVQKLREFRSEIVDGSDDLIEYYRAFQCSAFNAIMSVITCLQDQEKFYNQYIFKVINFVIAINTGYSKYLKYLKLLMINRKKG